MHCVGSEHMQGDGFVRRCTCFFIGGGNAVVMGEKAGANSCMNREWVFVLCG